MASRFHVGIYANAGKRTNAGARRFACEDLQLRRRFHVKKTDAATQSFADLLARFAHAGKDDRFRIHTGALQAKKLAERDNVESAAQPGQ